MSEKQLGMFPHTNKDNKEDLKKQVISANRFLKYVQIHLEIRFQFTNEDQH